MIVGVDPEAFWNRVVKPFTGDGCWIWIGAVQSTGYGLTYSRVDGRQRREMAHRVSWELEVGPIPIGHVLDHLTDLGCVGGPCVNPDHLEPVTQEENRRRQRDRQTHCRRGGHPLADAYVSADGERHCRPCHAEAQLRYTKARAERSLSA